MDIKITSITPEIMKIALEQAKDGRLHILGEMAKAMTGARSDVAATAPRITVISVPKEKIREVIGTGGKVIRDIVEQSGAKVDIEDDGTIKIAATSEEASQKAIDMIRGIVAEPEVGVIYNGKVVKTAEFGAFVNFLGAKDGLVHISELQQGRVNKTTDVVKEGDQVKVKVLGFDDRGKVKLSMRVVDQETGADITRAGRRQAGPGWRRPGRSREDGPRRRRGAARVPRRARAAARAHRRRRLKWNLGGAGPFIGAGPPIVSTHDSGTRAAMKAVNGIRMGGVDVLPLIEGGKGIGVSNGISSGHWAEAGGAGTFSAVNADYYDERGNPIEQLYQGRTRRERHDELIEFGIQGGIAQAQPRLGAERRQGPHPRQHPVGDGRRRARHHRRARGRKGPDPRPDLRRRHAVPAVGHRRQVRRLLLPDRLLVARLQRALEARLLEGRGPAGRRRLRGPVARRRP